MLFTSKLKLSVIGRMVSSEGERTFSSLKRPGLYLILIFKGELIVITMTTIFERSIYNVVFNVRSRVVRDNTETRRASLELEITGKDFRRSVLDIVRNSDGISRVEKALLRRLLRAIINWTITLRTTEISPAWALYHLLYVVCYFKRSK